MHRSKVARLPAEIREQIEAAWREGRVTLDELMELVKRTGADAASDPENGVSRSGLHRYLKSFGEAAERMREAEKIAGATVAKLGEPGSGSLRRMLTQLLSMVAMYQLRAIEDVGAQIKPSDLAFLARAVRDIEGAFRTGTDTELVIKKSFAAELEKKVAAIQPDAKTGLDRATLDRAKELVRGLL
jgi:Protein of unknown function (DUF3486)